MSTDYEILTPPSVEPVVLADMKVYLRVDYTDEDTLISQLISDARSYAEQITRRALAPQSIRATITPDLTPEGALSGPIGDNFDIYQLNERVSTIPFGLYGPNFPLPFPPVTAISLVEYQLTAFDGTGATMQWTTLPATDVNNNANYLLDTNVNPTRVVMRPLIAASRYRITFTAGYASGSCPFMISNQIKALASFWYDNRQGQPIPDSITQALARERVWTL